MKSALVGTLPAAWPLCRPDTAPPSPSRKQFGAVHSLTRMLGPEESALCRETAAAAVGNLAANCEEAQGLLAEAGAVPLLVRVLGSGTPAARQHAARALRNLAGRDGRNKLQAMQAGAIPLLVELLRPASDPTTRAAAASALSNIACNCEETQRAIAAAGALPVICDLLEPTGCGNGRQGEQSAAVSPGGDDDQLPGPCTLACREAAAWLLSNLACSTEVRHALAKQEAVAASTAVAAAKAGAAPPRSSGGVVAGLVQLLSDGSEGGRQAAARAIKNLAAGQGNGYKARIAEAGAIPPLVQLLRSPADATRRAASSALWNLAYRANTNRRLIAQVRGERGPGCSCGQRQAHVRQAGARHPAPSPPRRPAPCRCWWACCAPAPTAQAAARRRLVPSPTSPVITTSTRG